MAKIVLNSQGVRELLKSEEILNQCIELGSEIQSRAGEHYQMETRHYPERNGVAVFPADIQGNRDNLKNNTLLKALKG